MLKIVSFLFVCLNTSCINEYVDIYIEVTDRTVDNFFETNFLSRWCGWKKPSVLVSYQNIIIFAYHTDGQLRGSFFSGSFKFIDAGKHIEALLFYFKRIIMCIKTVIGSKKHEGQKNTF